MISWRAVWALWSGWRWEGAAQKRHRCLSTCRIVLLFSCILWVGGAGLIGDGWNSPKSMGELSVPGKGDGGLFRSVSTRCCRP